MFAIDKLPLWNHQYQTSYVIAWSPVWRPLESLWIFLGGRGGVGWLVRGRRIYNYFAFILFLGRGPLCVLCVKKKNFVYAFQKKIF